MKRHPELFNNADTDIDTASLTFVLNGIRISTRDLVVQAADYGMTARRMVRPGQESRH